MPAGSCRSTLPCSLLVIFSALLLCCPLIEAQHGDYSETHSLKQKQDACCCYPRFATCGDACLTDIPTRLCALGLGTCELQVSCPPGQPTKAPISPPPTSSPPTTATSGTTRVPTPAPSTSGLVDPSAYSNTHVLLADGAPDAVTLYWNVEGANIHFGVIAKGQGWVGVGFSETGMIGGDVTIARLVDGAIVVEDMYIDDRSGPKLDAEQNLFNTAGTRTATETHVKYSRALVSADRSGQDNDILAGEIGMLVAWSSTSDTLGYHFPNGRAEVRLTLFDAVSVTSAAPTTAVAPTLGTTGAPTGAPSAAAPTPAGNNNLVDPGAYANSHSPISGFTFYWNIDGPNLDAAIIADNQGWVAWGLGTQMVGSDAVFAHVVDGVLLVEDVHLVDQVVGPVADSQQDTFDVGGSRTATQTHVKFKRPLVSPDTSGEDSDILPGKISMIVAYNPSSDAKMYHGFTTRAVWEHTLYVEMGTPTAAPTASAAPSASASPTTPAPTTQPGQQTFDATVYASNQTLLSDVVFYWSIRNGIFRGAMTAPAGVSMLGFGITDQEDGSMTGADFVVGAFNTDGTFEVRDRLGIGLVEPVLSNTSGLLETSGGTDSVTGNTFMTFERSVLAIDAEHRNLTSPDDSGLTQLIFSVNRNPISSALGGFNYHGPQDRVQFRIDLTSGIVVAGDNTKYTMILTHALCMVIGWSFFNNLAVFITMFIPKRFSWWFPVHIAAGSIGLTLILAGFIVQIIQVEKFSMLHFTAATVSPTKGWHGIIGVVLVFTMVFQVILGSTSDLMWRYEHKKSGIVPQLKVFPDMTHWWIGRTLIIVAFIQIILGIFEWTLEKWVYGVVAAWYGLLIIILILLFVLQATYWAKYYEAAGGGDSSDGGSSEEVGPMQEEDGSTTTSNM